MAGNRGWWGIGVGRATGRPELTTAGGKEEACWIGWQQSVGGDSSDREIGSGQVQIRSDQIRSPNRAGVCPLRPTMWGRPVLRRPVLIPDSGAEQELEHGSIRGTYSRYPCRRNKSRVSKSINITCLPILYHRLLSGWSNIVLPQVVLKGSTMDCQAFKQSRPWAKRRSNPSPRSARP